MNASWILAGVILGVFLAAAGGGWWVARRTAGRRARRSMHWKVLLLAVCGVTFAGYAYWIDSGQRRTTLHEVILDGAPAEAFANGEVIRRAEFRVEHPLVVHDLLIGPMYPPPSLHWADFDVQIAATLQQEDAPPLLSEQLTFKPRYQDTTWQPAYLNFTPQAEGLHTLTLRLLTPVTPAVHVRIADPLKTDGQRAPGY